jgi:parvulin-like peptidyl-prolyl isomerase
MQRFSIIPTILSTFIVAHLMVLYGCASRPDSNLQRANKGRTTNYVVQAPLAHKPPEGEPISTIIDARPAALVNGVAVTWGELRPSLTELAGAEALQELVLDRKIQEALVASRITLESDAPVAERKLLLQSLNEDPNVAIRLAEELRDRQKLGSHRFEALLRRNAGLRALVRHRVSINEDAIQTMHEVVHGPKRQARLIVVPDLKSAEAAENLLKTGVTFADVAVEMSIDSSAPRGGLLEPISRADPAYPESLRQTLFTLNPGELSGPVLVDDRYAIIMLVKRVAGDGVKVDDARPALERLVRINQERILMDQLARRMLSETTVSVFDDALNESWKRRTLPR